MMRLRFSQVEAKEYEHSLGGLTFLYLHYHKMITSLAFFR